MAEGFIEQIIGYHDLKINGGAAVARRAILNLIGLVTLADNTATGETDLTLTTGVADSILTPTALAVATQYDNYDPGWAGFSILRITPAAGGNTMTGLVAPTGGASAELLLINVAGAEWGRDLTLAEQDSGSIGANRFINVSGIGDPLPGNGHMRRLVYDTVATRWRVYRVT